MPRLLLVEDEPDVLESTRFAFEFKGYEVTTAASAEEALDHLATSRPQVLLIDYKLPGMTGADLLRQVKGIDPQARVIMITGLTHESEAIEAECRALGAAAFLHKPLKTDEVFDVVSRTLAQPPPRS